MAHKLNLFPTLKPWHGLGMREDAPAPELPPEEPKGPMNKERALKLISDAIFDCPSGSETEEDLVELREWIENLP